jgi:hypothetical protein
MANEKKPVERKFVDVKSGKETKNVAAEGVDGKTPKARANGMRIFAVLLWLLAIAAEVVVIALINGILYLTGDAMIWMIAGIVLDLILVVAGAFLWKKANRIDPASEKNKVKFFLWNNMGVIAAVIAFFPLVLILLNNKELDAKTKKIVSVVATIALIAAVGLSIDYNPVSAEDLEAAKEAAILQNDGDAYWTQWGKSYHFDPDCHTLMRSKTVYKGTIEEAFEANRTDPCDFCAGGKEAKEQNQ